MTSWPRLKDVTSWTSQTPVVSNDHPFNFTMNQTGGNTQNKAENKCTKIR